MKEHNASAIPAAVFFDACVRSSTFPFAHCLDECLCVYIHSACRFECHDHLCCAHAVTSGSISVSRFHASQKLNNLLLFLQVWDPDSLQRSHPSCPSRLAQTVAVPFPDHLVSDNHRDRFRSAFGFVVEHR